MALGEGLLKILFSGLYTLAIIGLSLYGIQSLLLSLMFVVHRLRNRGSATPARPPDPQEWPKVTVQLPIYNERFVVERLINAACALDYPSDCLSIQILDDSTDDTINLTRRQVAYHRARGLNIELLHRTDRSGYKAGALAEGMKAAPGEFIAIFDADFVPFPDFLRRTIPYLVNDPQLGLVQGRWVHLNDDDNLLTRAQALFLDGHFVIEQGMRSRLGLLFNFNGSAGVWRRTCIEATGGWHGDTLAEDLDLSYRAQLAGWQLAFIPEVEAPAEIPSQMAAVKQQQYRWARGSIQVLLKLAGPLWRSNIPFLRRLAGTVHLSGYISHLLMMVLLLSSLPVVISHGVGLPSMQWLSLVGFGPPLLFALSQWATYKDWKRRMAYFPVLMAMGIGIGFNNARAVIAAFSRRPAPFIRTPKYRLDAQASRPRDRSYALPIDWTVWSELLLALYALLTAILAVKEFPPLTPLLVMFTVGFGYVGILGLLQGRRPARSRIGEDKTVPVKPSGD